MWRVPGLLFSCTGDPSFRLTDVRKEKEDYPRFGMEVL
jgi:hypothetical protein